MQTIATKKLGMARTARRAVFGGLVAGIALLGGCASSGGIPVIYSPSSTLTGAGAVQVSNFKYLPAADGKIAPRQLKNTAMGSIILDQNVDAFFRDSVFKELRFVGIKVDDKDRVLGGEIKQFLVDDLGYSVDWTLDVRYVITSVQSGKVLYDSAKITKRNTAKFVNFSEALNGTIKANVEDMLKDPAFMEAIN